MHTDDENGLPQALIDELKGADRKTRLLTSKVDREIEAAASAHFAGRKRPLWQSRPAWAAIAASLLVAVFLARPQLQSPEMAPAHIGLSGPVDIVDVFMLARNDRSIPQAELDAMAFSLVALSTEEGS